MNEDLIDIIAIFEARKELAKVRRYEAMRENNFKAAQVHNERIEHIDYGLKTIKEFFENKRK